MARRLVVLGALLALAALIAFWLRDFIAALFVAPLIGLLWVVGLVLRSISQSSYWIAVVGLVAAVALVSLVTRLHFGLPFSDRRQVTQGPVERLAAELGWARRGPYLKWLVANQLAELARTILGQRRQGPAQEPHKLQGHDWQPPARVQAYLEAGLDRPPLGHGRKSAGGPAGALDVDPAEVVDYLESQMETRT